MASLLYRPAAKAVCRAARQLRLGEGPSCGVATTTEHGSETAKLLLTASDAAKYQAKRRGCCFDPVAADDPFGDQDPTRLHVVLDA